MFKTLLSVSSDLFGIIFPYLSAYIVHFINGILPSIFKVELLPLMRITWQVITNTVLNKDTANLVKFNRIY